MSRKAQLNGLTFLYKERGQSWFHSEMRLYPSLGLESVIMTNKTSFISRKELSRVDSIFMKKP